ncbi:LacI family DNA-binding transcriptional regulator [Fontibacillus sp. BL9]|uniref:LacI family DNA-binding transcriptional regulator n=1 Tax=Fontibacillus sp. BL9 TaxID=3389971 RepID=UPI00397D35C9
MATIHDVALKAGVSVTTVSRVLNDRGYISETTRNKVYGAMRELNYQPNELARSLLRKQSNLLGLILPDVSHPFFAKLAERIEYYADREGYKILLCNSQMNPAKERDYIDMLKRSRVDGIIMGSHTLEIGEYRNLHSRLVTFDRKIGEDIPYLSSDNYRGGTLATELLISKGCRKILHICGSLALDMLSQRRTDAFLDAVRKAGVEHVIVQTEMNGLDEERYRGLLQAVLEAHPDLDGIFATSDVIAAYALKECIRTGRSVPGDVRIVGYDDVGTARWVTPELTTIRQPIDGFGREAVRLLQMQIEGLAVSQQNELPVELVERGTT